ncbi:thioredoxin family protein [Bacteroidales bacterium OttesenSCG-928-J16]|nr:thioredoxin family protein [Bacteroidales bacterium OttesenSCG-928-J16]
MIARLVKADFLEEIYDFEGPEAPQNRNEKPVAVLFYKTGDERSVLQLEILNVLAEKFPDILFYKIDVMQEQLLAADLGICRVPAILFAPVGGALSIVYGLCSETTLEKTITKVLRVQTP